MSPVPSLADAAHVIELPVAMPCFGLLCTSLEPASVRRAKRYRKLVPQLFPPEEPSVEGALEPKVMGRLARTLRVALCAVASLSRISAPAGLL